MSESARTRVGAPSAGERSASAVGLVRENGADQLLATGQFVECIFSCRTCGLSGSSIARPAMLEGKTCFACGELVVVTVL